MVQEVFEILSHVLWETVNVYFEHREQGHDVSTSLFLYPFLGKDVQQLGEVVREVQDSILQKVREANRPWAAAPGSEIGAISETVSTISKKLPPVALPHTNPGR